MPKNVQKRGRTAMIAGAAITALLLLGLTVYRAAVTGLTYDEAFTYLSYSRFLQPQDIWWMLTGSIANNHLLNTVLIRVVEVLSGTRYSEFIIRLHSLAFYAAFLGMAVYMLAKREISLPGFAMLALCYYLNDFFGFARGYGIAVCLLLFALRYYQRWRAGRCERHGDLTWSLAFFTAAATAQTLSLMVFAPVGIVALGWLICEKKLTVYIRRQWFWLTPLALGTLAMVRYHLWLSQPGKPLPIIPPTVFDALGLGFVSLYTPVEPLVLALAILLCVFLGAGVTLFFKKALRSTFLLPLLLHVLFWTAAQAATGLLPDKRSMLITVPLAVLALAEMGRWYVEALRKRLTNRPVARWLGQAPGVLLALALAATFLLTTRPNSTEAWFNNYAERDIAYAAYETRAGGNEALHEIEPYPLLFYREKILYEHGYNIFENWWGFTSS